MIAARYRFMMSAILDCRRVQFKPVGRVLTSRDHLRNVKKRCQALSDPHKKLKTLGLELSCSQPLEKKKG